MQGIRALVGVKFCYRGECLLIVNSIRLGEPFCHEACVEPLYASMSFVFDSENPFATHRLFSWWQLGNVPCFVLFKCLNLLQDGCFPFGYFDCLVYGMWNLYLVEIADKSTEARRKTLIGYKIIDRMISTRSHTLSQGN